MSRRQLVAAVLATIIRTLTRRGGSHLHLDGHRDDNPHLQPVLTDLPHARAQPIDLIESPSGSFRATVRDGLIVPGGAVFSGSGGVLPNVSWALWVGQRVGAYW